MPRYFFHIANGQEFLDESGTDLAGITEARAQAIKTANAMLHTISTADWLGEQWRLNVVDETGASVIRLRFAASGIESIGDSPVPATSFELSEAEAALLIDFRRIADRSLQTTIGELVKSIADEYPPAGPNLRVV